MERTGHRSEKARPPEWNKKEDRGKAQGRRKIWSREKKEQDRGVIALLDERFMDRRCQEVFPREWNDFQICNSENIEEKIAGFWKEEQMDKR